MGDGGTAGGKDQGDNQSSPAQLRDIHGAGYPPAIEAGVQAVMASFSSVGGVSTVSARFTLDRYNLRDRNPAFTAADERIVQHLRGLGAVLTRTGIAKHGPEGTTP